MAAQPRCLVWAPYWLINKTGLRLAYLLQSNKQPLLEPAFDTGSDADPDAAAAAKGGERTPRASYESTASCGAASLDHDAASEASCASSAAALHGPLAESASPRLRATDGGGGGAPPPLPLLLACGAGEQLVVQVRPYGHRPRIGGRAAAIRAPAIRGLLMRKSAKNQLAVGCSAAFSMDALGAPPPPLRRLPWPALDLRPISPRCAPDLRLGGRDLLPGRRRARLHD